MKDENAVEAGKPSYSAMNGLVHIDDPGTDTTLCGDALENGEGDRPAMPVVEQRLSCERCIQILEYAALVPKKVYRQRKRRR